MGRQAVWNFRCLNTSQPLKIIASAASPRQTLMKKHPPSYQLKIQTPWLRIQEFGQKLSPKVSANAKPTNRQFNRPSKKIAALQSATLSEDWQSLLILWDSCLDWKQLHRLDVYIFISALGRWLTTKQKKLLGQIKIGTLNFLRLCWCFIKILKWMLCWQRCTYQRKRNGGNLA